MLQLRLFCAGTATSLLQDALSKMWHQPDEDLAECRIITHERIKQ